MQQTIIIPQKLVLCKIPSGQLHLLTEIPAWCTSTLAGYVRIQTDPVTRLMFIKSSEENAAVIVLMYNQFIQSISDCVRYTTVGQINNVSYNTHR